MNAKADFFFVKNLKWQKELETLRKIILAIGLNEELKWGVPCYTINKKNIVLIHAFKEYCAVLFFKGALLKDAKGILVQQTRNVQSARQVRYTNVREIVQTKSTLKAYIREAISIEQAGLKVELKKTTEFTMPDEFKDRLEKSAALKKAFTKLTPGRQRGYLLYFSSAKQAKTSDSRIDKNVKRILEGKGLED